MSVADEVETPYQVEITIDGTTVWDADVTGPNDLPGEVVVGGVVASMEFRVNGQHVSWEQLDAYATAMDEKPVSAQPGGWEYEGSDV